METTSSVLDPSLIDFITKAKKLRQQQRNASNKYYTSKFKTTDTMTDSQKQEIADNIEKRKAIYKARYDANKELYKQRSKEYRDYRKMCEQQNISLIVNVLSAEPANPI